MLTPKKAAVAVGIVMMNAFLFLKYTWTVDSGDGLPGNTNGGVQHVLCKCYHQMICIFEVNPMEHEVLIVILR